MQSLSRADQGTGSAGAAARAAATSQKEFEDFLKGIGSKTDRPGEGGSASDRREGTGRAPDDPKQSQQLGRLEEEAKKKAAEELTFVEDLSGLSGAEIVSKLEERGRLTFEGPNAEKMRAAFAAELDGNASVKGAILDGLGRKPDLHITYATDASLPEGEENYTTDGSDAKVVLAPADLEDPSEGWMSSSALGAIAYEAPEVAQEKTAAELPFIEGLSGAGGGEIVAKLEERGRIRFAGEHAGELRAALVEDLDQSPTFKAAFLDGYKADGTLCMTYSVGVLPDGAGSMTLGSGSSTQVLIGPDNLDDPAKTQYWVMRVSLSGLQDLPAAKRKAAENAFPKETGVTWEGKKDT